MQTVSIFPYKIVFSPSQLTANTLAALEPCPDPVCLLQRLLLHQESSSSSNQVISKPSELRPLQGMHWCSFPPPHLWLRSGSSVWLVRSLPRNTGHCSSYPQAHLQTYWQSKHLRVFTVLMCHLGNVYSELCVTCNIQVSRFGSTFESVDKSLLSSVF